MKLIRELDPTNYEAFEPSVALTVERRVLAKRRWRGQAEDGKDFGFDLEAPLKHGVCFHFEEGRNYVIDQKPEEVFRVPFPNHREAAHRAWQVGNLHFPAQFMESCLLVEGDLAVRHMLDRNGIPFEESVEVFEPLMIYSGHRHDYGNILKYFNRW